MPSVLGKHSWVWCLLHSLVKSGSCFIFVQMAKYIWTGFTPKHSLFWKLIENERFNWLISKAIQQRLSVNLANSHLCSWLYVEGGIFKVIVDIYFINSIINSTLNESCTFVLLLCNRLAWRDHSELCLWCNVTITVPCLKSLMSCA